MGEGQKELTEQIAALSFEQAMERLEKVVESLENGDVPLENALDLYQEGIYLARHCDQKLTQVEQRIQVLVEEDGEMMTKAFPTKEDY